MILKKRIFKIDGSMAKFKDTIKLFNNYEGVLDEIFPLADYHALIYTYSSPHDDNHFYIPEAEWYVEVPVGLKRIEKTTKLKFGSFLDIKNISNLKSNPYMWQKGSIGFMGQNYIESNINDIESNMDNPTVLITCEYANKQTIKWQSCFNDLRKAPILDIINAVLKIETGVSYINLGAIGKNACVFNNKKIIFNAAIKTLIKHPISFNNNKILQTIIDDLIKTKNYINKNVVIQVCLIEKNSKIKTFFIKF
jgi:hypothetical protein